MEHITWAEYQKRKDDINGFKLTHYSKLFSTATCLINIRGLEMCLNWDIRYSEHEWNNQYYGIVERHADHWVEITPAIAQEIKDELIRYESAYDKVDKSLKQGLAGYDYNTAISNRSHAAMMINKYNNMIKLLP